MLSVLHINPAGKSYGVHMNGYVRQNGEIRMWVGKRSPTKSRYPGLYDNMVAGGIRYQF